VDNGSGMSHAIKKKIFNRFFSTKGSAGSGIGLMATKKIIDAHQGEITVKSEANVGSEFTIRLPRGLKIED
jgi:signal transduction histidine kinase